MYSYKRRQSAVDSVDESEVDSWIFRCLVLSAGVNLTTRHLVSNDTGTSRITDATLYSVIQLHGHTSGHWHGEKITVQNLLTKVRPYT